MNNRPIIIIASVTLIVAGFFGKNYLSSLKDTSERVAPKPQIRSAAYVEVHTDTLRGNIPVTGKLVAKDRIEIYAEVSGNLLSSSSRFKSGNKFSAGERLVAIDNTELSLSVISQKSNFLSTLTRILPDLKLDYPEVFEVWKNYTDQFSVERSLKNLPDINGSEKYFLSTQGVLNQYYAIKSQEARLAKYSISAPYSGTVAAASIKPGTLVRAGQKLGEFIRLGAYELEVAIDLEYLQYITIGAQAELSSNQVPGKFMGKVVRVSESLDANTQSAKVILELEGASLKEGMYLNGMIFTEPFFNSFLLANKQLNDQDETYIIREGKLRVKALDVLFRGENEVITSGLKDGDKILENLYDGVKDGAPVMIEGSTPEKKGSESEVNTSADNQDKGLAEDGENQE